MKNKLEEILVRMDDINYGFVCNEKIYSSGDDSWYTDFSTYYRLSSPCDVIKNKYAVCWDQVELARYYLENENINCNSYMMISYDEKKIPTHTFLVITDNDKYYYFEHSFEMYRGVYEYSSLKELLLDVKNKFEKYLSENNLSENLIFTYRYDKPNYGITCDQFYKHCEAGELIKLNEPLYFYHLVNEGADVSKGLFSLQYMYDNKLYDEFDKHALKYKDRIIDDWNISKYKGKHDLTREEYIDGLEIFRGKYGAANIYFFRYPPYKELGHRMEEILKYKDIYRININDEEVELNILDIFYGFDMSNSDNKVLNKKYYEDISSEDYFKKYDDTLTMNFSTLNHIGIVFKDFYCPAKFLEKVDS